MKQVLGCLLITSVFLLTGCSSSDTSVTAPAVVPPKPGAPASADGKAKAGESSSSATNETF